MLLLTLLMLVLTLLVLLILTLLMLLLIMPGKLECSQGSQAYLSDSQAPCSCMRVK